MRAYRQQSMARHVNRQRERACARAVPLAAATHIDAGVAASETAWRISSASRQSSALIGVTCDIKHGMKPRVACNSISSNKQIYRHIERGVWHGGVIMAA